MKNNLEATKTKNINKLNKDREDYEERRSEGFIKTYKAVRHKKQPRYRKQKLKDIHPYNIQRPPKFSDVHNSDDTPMDTTN